MMLAHGDVTFLCGERYGCHQAVTHPLRRKLGSRGVTVAYRDRPAVTAALASIKGNTAGAGAGAGAVASASAVADVANRMMMATSLISLPHRQCPGVMQAATLLSMNDDGTDTDDSNVDQSGVPCPWVPCPCDKIECTEGKITMLSICLLLFRRRNISRTPITLGCMRVV